MLFGYEDKISAFKKLIANGNLRQSYLFFGDAGIGKASFARLLGNFLEYGKFEAGEKPLIDSKTFSPNENGVLGIETALKIRKFLWATPFHSQKRFAIIDDAQVLTPEAQSALLKVVEEPPAKALLVFVTFDTEALFPPLLSRLTKVYFPRLSEETISEILIKHYEVPAPKARRMSAESFGRLGRALGLLEGKKSLSEEPDLETEIENEILVLRKEGLLKNARKLAFLLSRLALLKRYNLNSNLQRKAIVYQISHV